MIIRDKKSFLLGLQLGRRLKAWDAARERPQQEQSRTVEVVEIPEEEEESDG